MTPIPTHLAVHQWYPGHLAWRRAHGLPARHDPGGAQPVRALLAGADLRGAVLAGADLSGAYLRYADLTGAVLAGADLRGADLRYADLRGADLRGSDLSGAYLRGADLRDAVLADAVLAGADLRGADLRGADLTGAIGIASAGPVGAERRTIYAVAHGDTVMVQAGCSWRTVDDTVAAIRERYADGTGREHHREAYIAAVLDAAKRVSS